MVLMPVIQEVQAAHEYGGWLIIIIPLILMAAILLWRSYSGTKPWREVWLGSPAPRDSFWVLEDERTAGEALEESAWDEVQERWDTLTEEQQKNWRRARDIRMAALEEHLKKRAKQLEVERLAWEQHVDWCVVAFWALLILSLFGLAGIVWDWGFEFAMGLAFVKGRPWFAGAIVVFVALAAVGVVATIFEELNAKASP